MDIYVLILNTYPDDYAYSQIIGVFDNPEKAEDAKKQFSPFLGTFMDDNDELVIVPFKLNEIKNEYDIS